MFKYQDSSLPSQERAQDLLEKLSLEEKMAQITCFFAGEPGQYKGLDAIPAGVGNVSTLNFRSCKTLEECVRFQREIQEKIMSQSPHKIPAIFHMEGICGAYIQDATSFPSNINRGSSWDPQLEEEIGMIVGEQERAMGITYTLAPVLDINREPRNGRQGEAYGGDPTLAASLGVSLIRGLQNGQTDGRRTESVAKHFVAYHASEAGVNGAAVEMSEKMLREQYSKPFQAAITEADLMAIMPCYSSLNGEPLSSSKKYLTGLLREEMGFQGTLVSDYGAISLIKGLYHVVDSDEAAGLCALEAGMDMEWAGKSSFNDKLAEWFRKEKADISLLDSAVKRVLEAKFRMGLFEHPFAMEAEEIRKLYKNPKNAEVTLQSARESMILLKNNGILPLDRKKKKIAVIGYHASNARIYFSGYTHFSMTEALMADVMTMEGTEENAADKLKKIVETIPGTRIQADRPEFEELMRHQKPGIKSLYEQIKDELPEAEVSYSFGYHFAGDDESGFEEALKKASDADVIILTLGGKNSCGLIASMGENIDSTDINLPSCQEHFIEEAAKLNKPMIGIHFNGRPISSDAADKYLDAIIEAWNPSEMGSPAIVDILLGNYNPGGKLPVDVPYTSGQVPVYYNHLRGSSAHSLSGMMLKGYIDMPHTPRYPFGHGLSYTEFAYSNLKFDRTRVAPEETIEISMKIKNIGKMTGNEVVQLYFTDCYACVSRPVMELMGYQRITLQPTEEKTITFRVNMTQTAFLDREAKWLVEAGDIDVSVGSSSADIRLNGTFTIMESAYVEGRTRGFYAESIITN